jgi:hypothetical protein
VLSHFQKNDLDIEVTSERQQGCHSGEEYKFEDEENLGEIGTANFPKEVLLGVVIQ